MHKMMSRVMQHLLYRGKGIGKCRANSIWAGQTLSPCFCSITSSNTPAAPISATKVWKDRQDTPTSQVAWIFHGQAVEMSVHWRAVSL